MTLTEPFLDTRPRIRPDVALGPALVRGAARVHNLKDARTGRFFQIGEREFFLISRLDGTRTLAEIGADYAQRFRRRLDERRWRQLLGMLAQRRLLAGTDNPVPVAEPVAAGLTLARGRRGPAKALFPLVDPNRLLGLIEPRMRFVFSRYFVIPVLCVAAVVMSLTAVNFVELTRESEQVRTSPVATGLVIAVYWLSMAVHECAHGLVCRHYGGSVHEIGVMWRFPVIAPYCDVGDVVVLPSRWHRFHTAFAGVFTTMVILVSAGLLWLVAPAGSAPRGFAAGLLLLFLIGALANLVPVFRLDGYYMLNHALGMQNLDQESIRCLLARVRGGRAAVRHYPSAYRRIYIAYGSVSLLASAGFAIAACWWVITLLRPHLGTQLSAIVVSVAAGVVLTVVLGVRRRRRGKS